jgi:hypothetical protein
MSEKNGRKKRSRKKDKKENSHKEYDREVWRPFDPWPMP